MKIYYAFEYSHDGGWAVLVNPAQLLEDSEQGWREHWRLDPKQSVLAADAPRRAMVLEALVAYRVLCRANGVLPDVVFERWPACTAAVVLPVWSGVVRPQEFANAVALAEVNATRAIDTPSEAMVDTPNGTESWALWDAGGLASVERLGLYWLPPSQLPTAGTPSPSPTAAPPLRTRAVVASAPPARPVGADLAMAPELRIRTDGSGISLRLPGESGDPAWDLSLDGESVAAHPPHWTLPKPVRWIEATAPGGTSHRIQVVDPRTVLLAFDETGRHIPAGEVLPAGEVILLHAGEVATEGASVALVELPAPFGWTGWTLTRTSLARVRRLRVGSAASESWMTVAATGAPRLEGGTPVVGLTGVDGEPIWSVPPRLLLPADIGPRGRGPWLVTVQRPGSEQPLVHEKAAPSSALDPWARVERPLLGAYEMVIRRQPGSRGRRIRVSVAEGVSASVSAQWRLLAPGGGLAPAVVHLTGTHAVTPSRRGITLGPFEVEASVRLRSAAEQMTVRVAIPHTELRLELSGQAQRWTLRPIDIDAADLSRGCSITVRVPPEAAVGQPELALLDGDTVLQSITPEHRTRAADGDLRYPLAALADTMRGCHRAELRLRLAGHQVLVATVRTQPIAESVSPDGSGLRLHGLRHPGVLSASIHLANGPWLSPTTADVHHDGSLALPATLRDAGPLVVHLRPGIPHTQDQAPGWPDLRDQHTFVLRRRTGAPESGTAVERAFSAYLAGTRPLPTGPDTWRYLWLIAVRGKDLRFCGARESAERECVDRLGADPVSALRHAADSGLRPTEIASVLVRSGLAAHALKETENPEEVLRVWRASPLSGMLLTSPLLPYLADHPSFPAEELYPDEQALLNEMQAYCGDVAVALLAGQQDPARGSGRFGSGERQLARMPEIHLEALWHTTGILPTALLDSGTRADAARKAFLVRRELAVHARGEDFAEWLDSIEMLLRDRDAAAPTTTGECLLDAFLARSPGLLHEPDESWMQVPQISLGFALVARLAAWGDGQAAGLERMFRRTWSQLAACIPDLTAVDLALAECLAAAHYIRTRS